MSGGFHVDTDAMRSHAATVRGLTAQAGTAVSAARQVNFGPTMYGQIGQMLVFPLMAPLQGAGVLSTEAVKEMLQETAEGVTELANGYDAVEDAVVDAMTWVKGKL